MKKMIKVLGLVAIMTLSMSMQVFAGEWKKDNIGWWYQNDDNTYPVNIWAWLDGNKDGVAECYYFNESGYCLMATATPDNYTVNENGAWTVNGVVQTKSVSMNIESIKSGSTDREDKENISNNRNEMSNAEKERQMLRDMGLTDEQIDQMIRGSLGESMYGGLN